MSNILPALDSAVKQEAGEDNKQDLKRNSKSISNPEELRTSSHRQSLIEKASFLGEMSLTQDKRSSSPSIRKQSSLQSEYGVRGTTLISDSRKSSKNQKESSLNTTEENKNILDNIETNSLTLVSGNISGNKLDGTCRLNADDYVYSGQWADSKFVGYGRITKKTFALYEGQFNRNMREGYGVEIYINSDIYIGEFKTDKKNGQGIYLFANGGYYFGFFENNFRSGFGTLYNKANRQTYTGVWKQDKKHGRGIEFYKNGSKYDGYFVNDKREGIGFMEYSKSLLYIGEWIAGKKDGLGKVEHNKKTISGRFKDDNFVEPFFFNPSSHADHLLTNPLAKSVEEYLISINYKFKKPLLKNVGDLYNVLKESLVSYVLSLVENSVLRLSCYLKLKNIFSKSSRFEYFMDDLLIFLKYEPNISNLMVFWDPALREILINKQDFSWQRWECQFNSSKVVFDELQKNNESTDIIFNKTEDNLDLIVTNELAMGIGTTCESEGVVANDAINLRYYNRTTGEWDSTNKIIIFPFFLLQEANETKSILSLKIMKYTGEFYFGKDNTNPKKLVMYLSIDQEDTWYSIGLDSVGVFIIAGKWNKSNSTGQLLQKYFLEYQIEYELFLANNEKLQGLWKTTNLGGHFVLRKDTSFRFSAEMAQILYCVFEKQKGGSQVNLNDIPELKSSLNSSILSVIVTQSQGGVPNFGEKKEEEEDMKLFEKYKKLQETDSSLLDAAIKKISLQNNSPQNPPVTDKDKDLENQEKDLADAELDFQVSNISKKARASLALLNLKALEDKTSHVLQEIKKDTQRMESNEFQNKLSYALRGLKQVVSENLRISGTGISRSSENISWIGNMMTLGKEEQVIFDNLYIIGDVIEGIFTDSNNESYELAGSYSLRTKEFEIVGMSFDKHKSMKIKGTLDNFKLSGMLTKKPLSGPSSNIQIKLLGYEGKAILKFPKENHTYDNLELIFKLTDSYLYGMIMFEKDYVFLNGWNENKSGFGLELNANNKKIKNLILFQSAVEEEEYPKNDKSRVSSSERKLFFKNDELEIILFY